MLPTYEQVLATSREGSAFSNGTEWECWSANWCDRCVHDAVIRRGGLGGCVLIAFAMGGERTPAEWAVDKPGTLYEPYRCVYFRDEKDGGGDPEPRPIPDPPGQGVLVPREPYEQARMLTTYPTPAEVAHAAAQ